MPENDSERILIRGVNWIGDAVMTMPAIHAVRKAWPSARISLLVKPWVAPLFEKDPHVDEILLYRDDHRGVMGKFRLAAELGKRRFTRAILLQNAFDAAAAAVLGAIPERIGYARDGRRLLLTTAVPFDQRAAELHHIDYYLHLLRRAGIRAAESVPWIYLSLEERAAALARLEALRRPVVGVNPGAAYGSSKRWPADRFASVAARIIDEEHGSVVIFGGPAEAGISAEIEKAVMSSGSRIGRVLNVAGMTGLRELAALIAECDVLLTNDSGPMHMGYAVGTPVVAVFGSTSPQHTGPVGPKDVVVQAGGIDCSPCFDRECSKGHLRCMEAIGVDEVFDAVRGLLPRQRAVFFDRDGTLCHDPGYLRRMDDLVIFPEVRDLAALKDAGYMLIGVTNQSGVARGIVEEGFVQEVNNLFCRDYGFSRFYYCPHHPDERCACRKPEPGLLIRARADFGIDLRRSYVVGDREIDMALAAAVGSGGILVQTGQESSSALANHTVRNLTEAAKIVLGRQAQ